MDKQAYIENEQKAHIYKHQKTYKTIIEFSLKFAYNPKNSQEKVSK